MTVEGLRRKREQFGVDNPGYLTPKHKLGSLVLEEWHVEEIHVCNPCSEMASKSWNCSL